MKIQKCFEIKYNEEFNVKIIKDNKYGITIYEYYLERIDYGNLLHLFSVIEIVRYKELKKFLKEEIKHLKKFWKD